MNRVSILPVAQYCGQAATRGTGAAGRPAIMSSAFHAVCAEQTDANVKLMSLTPEERATIEKWEKPQDTTVEGVPFSYDACEKEVTLGLTREGEYCEIDKFGLPVSGDLITIGHMDFGTILRVGDKNVAIIGDMKKSRWTVDGPETLQLHAYGMAYASKVKADGYIPILWLLEEGEYIFGPYFDLDSWEIMEILPRIVHAATNEGEAVTGSHCRKCYARTRCIDHLFPAMHADEWLAPLAENGGLENCDEAEIAALLLKVQAVEDVAVFVKDELKSWTLNNGGSLRAGDRIWGMSQRAGNVTVNKKKLIADLGDGADKYLKQGKPVISPRWRKA